MSTFEGQAESARKGAKDVTEKAMFSPSATSRAHSTSRKSWCRRKDVEEVLKLQADYIKTQMQVLAEQAKELGESTSKVARDTAKSRH